MFDCNTMKAPTQQTINIAGQVHHLSAWPGQTPRIFALHGFTGVGDDYRALAYHLGQAFLAPDLMGHGRSSAPTSRHAYKLEQIINNLSDLMDPMDILMGYSLGARLALELVCQGLVRPRAMILLSGTPGLEDPAERAIRRAEDDARADAIMTLGASAFLESWRQTPLIRSQERACVRLKNAMQAGRSQHCSAGLAGAVSSLSPGRIPHRWDDLAAIETPTLLVSGSEDPKYSHLAERMQLEFKSARILTLEGVGHAPHIEAPNETSLGIRQFLSMLSPQ
jgi:2-succinyl-6-hydroxy-2,4-cyclohexadiene-1-carboxylate synthase